MPDLIPGFAERLQTRADEVAERRSARRRWRRWRWAGGSVAAGLAIASGAYAAGWWSPELGSNPATRPAALSTPPSPELRDALAPLRRPQTDADRGAAARYALRFPASERLGIQTRFVRTLSVGGLPAVLVPVVDLPSGAQKLCLWVGGGDDGSSRVCTSADAAVRGELIVSSEPLGSASTEAERAERRRAQGTPADESGGMLDDAPPSGAVTIIGLVPDGVRSARVGGAPPVPVTDNLFRLETDEPPGQLRATWDD